MRGAILIAGLNAARLITTEIRGVCYTYNGSKLRRDKNWIFTFKTLIKSRPAYQNFTDMIELIRKGLSSSKLLIV
jgi:hypothetical protein